PAARYIGGADAPSAGGRSVRAGRERQLPAPQFNAELTRWTRNDLRRPITKTKNKRATHAPLFRLSLFCQSSLAAGHRVGAACCWPSSFLRASSARRCNSSCSFFCCSSNTFGSVGGPS